MQRGNAGILDELPYGLPCRAHFMCARMMMEKRRYEGIERTGFGGQLERIDHSRPMSPSTSLKN